MTSTSRTIAARLTSAQAALHNALSEPDIRTALSQYGYTPERIAEGQALLDVALKTQLAQQKEYGEQYQSTQDRDDLWEKAKATYQTLFQAARIVFKNEPAYIQSLGLGGRRKESLSGWLLQTKQFYENALVDPVVVERLSVYNLTRDKFEAGRDEYLAVAEANARQLKEMGEARLATAQRDEALDAFDDWLEDFQGIARLALASREPLLKALNLG